MKIEYFNIENALPSGGLGLVTDFLYKELDQYGDSKRAIMKSINYAMGDPDTGGGIVAVMSKEERILGAIVINYTRMGDYIPDNILVYVAVHHEYRGKGIGKRLISATLEQIEGDVALHVEPGNPAMHLYRKIGFESKYVEMRLIRKEY